MYNYDNIENYRKIKELKLKGYTTQEISDELSIEKRVVKYLLSKPYEERVGRIIAFKEKEEQFEKDVIELLPNSNSMNDLCYHLGLRGVDGYYKKIQKVIEKYNLSTDHFGTLNVYRGGYRNKFTAMTNEEFFVDGCERNGKQLIKRLVDSGIKEYKCENPECGISEWCGKPISLQIHHINGNHYDNRIENLQLLCPNCHTQTDTYAKTNKTPGKKNIKTDKIKKEASKKEKTYDVYYKVYIPKDELIESIKTLGSYKAVSRKYGISDSAIRKKCKSFGIMKEIEPYIKHQIKHYR
jgi:hypothetical protein